VPMNSLLHNMARKSILLTYLLAYLYTVCHFHNFLTVWQRSRPRQKVFQYVTVATHTCVGVRSGQQTDFFLIRYTVKGKQ